MEVIVALTESVTDTIDSPTVRDYDILAAAEILGGGKVYKVGGNGNPPLFWPEPADSVG